MPIVEARDVVKVYDTGGERLEALKGVSVTVEPGEFIAIMGPSGSGKSTLLNVLGLLDEPTEGTVALDGSDVTGLDDRQRTTARKRTIGFVFQNFYLIPTLTARENVEIPRLLDRDPESRERAADLLRRVGLGDRLDYRPGELSGGQKQRVAIARALVNEPKLLLADEPTGNLDRKTGRQVLDLFSEICAEGVAVVAVTHDLQVTDYADRTIHIVDGLVGEDIPEDDPSVGGRVATGSTDTAPDGTGVGAGDTARGDVGEF